MRVQRITNPNKIAIISRSDPGDDIVASKHRSGAADVVGEPFDQIKRDLPAATWPIDTNEDVAFSRVKFIDALTPEFIKERPDWRTADFVNLA